MSSAWNSRSQRYGIQDLRWGSYHALQHAGGFVEEYRKAYLRQVFANAVLEDAPKTCRWPIVALKRKLPTDSSIPLVLTLVNVLREERF